MRSESHGESLPIPSLLTPHSPLPSYPVCMNYTEKLLPQPQDFLAFGFSNVKPRRSMPS
jgi:hypothetical protein